MSVTPIPVSVIEPAIFAAEIELAAALAMEKYKIIPRGVYKKVKSKSKIDVNKILKIEGRVRHDVIAFLSTIME